MLPGLPALCGLSALGRGGAGWRSARLARWFKRRGLKSRLRAASRGLQADGHVVPP